MSDFLQILVGIFQEQGLIAAGLVFLSGVAIWLGQKYLPTYLVGLFIHNRRSESLVDHPFFTRISEWRSRRIPYLPIVYPIRRELTIDTLDIQFHVFEKRVARAVLDKDHLKAGSAGYEKFWRDIVLDAMKEYEREWRNIDAPDEWFEIFNEFNRHRVNNLTKRISQIANSSFHSSSYSRDVAILDSFMMVFWDTLTDAERTLHGLNGRLTGKMYKGKEIE